MEPTLAQVSSFTVNDRKPTPAAHVFVPRKPVPNGHSWVEVASVPIGENTFTLRLRESGTRYFVRATLAAPVLVTETINGVAVPKVHRVSFIDAQFRFENTSSLQERKDAVGMFVNALGASVTVVDATLTGLEAIW